jgi:2-polyprenyl-6-methoxyphenol hydroxylase-like FAD-dependent oxidoreductase
VRCRLADIENVRIFEGHEVIGLLASADGQAVAGVRLRPRPAAGGAADTVEDMGASFVVDASGRTSRAPEWLAHLGFEPPAETTISPFLGYASRAYAIPTEVAAEWRVLVLQAKPPEQARGGALFPIEGNRWLVSLTGAGGDVPPTDDEGFLAFAHSLRSPVLAEAIRDAAPRSPIFGYQRTANQRRAYERLARQPERFLVTGDALCAFNPVYAQGMTAAAQGALVLAQLLGERRDLAGLPRRFQAAVAKVNAGAWLVATGEDLRYPTTEGGERTLPTRLSHLYLDRVLGAATRDREVNRAFLNVLQLVAPPTTLFRPGIVVPALLHGGMGNEQTPPLV